MEMEVEGALEHLKARMPQDSWLLETKIDIMHAELSW